MVTGILIPEAEATKSRGREGSGDQWLQTTSPQNHWRRQARIGQARWMTSQVDSRCCVRSGRGSTGGWPRAWRAGTVHDGMWLIAVVWQVIDPVEGQTKCRWCRAPPPSACWLSSLAGGVLADRVSQRLITIGLEVTKLVAFASVGGVDGRAC